MPADEAIAKHLRSREKPPSWWQTKLTVWIPIRQWLILLAWFRGNLPDRRVSRSWRISLLEHVLLPWMEDLAPQEEVTKTLNTGRNLKQKKTAKKKRR